MRWDLPEGWSYCQLGTELVPVRVQAGPDQLKDDWTYVGLEHVQTGTGEYRGVCVGSASIKSNKFVFDEGDVLYGKLRPNLRKCVVATTSGVCSTDLVPLRPKDPQAAHFLALQMRSERFTAQVMRRIGGANLPRVTVKDLLALDLPKPPPSEQERLFALARGVVELRESMRRAKESVDLVDLAATAVALGLEDLSIQSRLVTAAVTPST